MTRNQSAFQKQRNLRKLLHTYMEEAAQTDLVGVGDRIRQARQEAGLTQDELSDLIGVGVRQIQYYEAGDSNPYRNLRRLGEALDKSVGWLLHGEPAIELLAERMAAQLDALEADLERVAKVVDGLARGETEILAAIENARSQVLARLDPPPARPKRRRA